MKVNIYYHGFNNLAQIYVKKKIICTKIVLCKHMISKYIKFLLQKLKSKVHFTYICDK